MDFQVTLKFMLVTLIVTATRTHAYYNKVLDKVDNALYLYPNNSKTMGDLPFCETASNEACSIVMKRFWLPDMIMPMCRCPGEIAGTSPQCSHRWSPNGDPYSIHLNSRSQFKLCGGGNGNNGGSKEPKQCSLGQIGVKVEEWRYQNRRNDDGQLAKVGGSGLNHFDTSGTMDSTLKRRQVSVDCSCSGGYWELARHILHKANTTIVATTKQYKCSRMTRCEKSKFCGHIRTDTYSAYYHCRCPAGTLCINTDKTVRNASELLYEGPMLRAYCNPIDQENNNGS